MEKCKKSSYNVEIWWKNAFSWLKIIVVIVILLVALSYTISAWLRIDAKTETRYSCEELHYDVHTIASEAVIGCINIADDEIRRIEIPITFSEFPNGELVVRIFSESGEQIFEQDVLKTGMVINNAIVLQVDQTELIKGKTYSLELTGVLSTPVFVEISDGQILRNSQYFTYADGTLYKICLCALNVFLVAILAVSIFVKVKIHTFFLIVALLVGTILVFVTPPLSVPDEYRHFVRAYQITKGELVASEYAPKDAYWAGSNPIAECDFPEELAAIKLINNLSSKTYAGETVSFPFLEKWKGLFNLSWSGDTIRTMYIGSSTINPLAYIPQLIGIWIAQIFFVPVWLFYGARLVEMIISVLLIYFAIRKTPHFKMLFFMIAMLPDVLFARSSCSTDGMLLGLVLLFIAWVLDIKCRDGVGVRKTDWCIFCVFSIMLSAIKVPYLLIFFLIMLIDSEKIFKKKLPWVFNNVIAVGLLLMLGLAFYVVSQKILGMYMPEGYPSPNLTYLLENPVKVLNLVAQTLLDNSTNYILDVFGVFGLLHFAFLLIVAQADFCPMINIRDRVFLLITYLAFLIGLTFAGYFMNVPMDYIWGIQTRYFIPALPILFMLGSGALPYGKTDLLKWEGLVRLVATGSSVLFIIYNFMPYYL